jgi:hypothetical protein
MRSLIDSHLNVPNYKEMHSVSQRCSYHSVGLHRIIFGVARPHTHNQTHPHTSGKTPLNFVISMSQRPLPSQHTTNVTKEYTCPQRNSNRRSQSSRCFRITTSRPHGHRARHKDVQHFQIPVRHQINVILEQVTEGKVEETGSDEDVSSYLMTERERMKCSLSVT